MAKASGWGSEDRGFKSRRPDILELCNKIRIFMSDKFKNKYRVPTTRLQNWDYSSNGYYFVTICTKDRKHYFGEITNNEMRLSEIGKIAQKYWLEIPNHFLFVI